MRAFFYSKCYGIFLCCCLATLLIACDSISPPNITSHAEITPSAIPTPPTLTTVPVPPTQTSCPASGTARALVTAPLVVGNHPTIIYTVTEHVAQSNVATEGILKRYDIDTGNKTVIATIPNRTITDASISPDGQWVLFSSVSNPSDAGSANSYGDSRLQAVRLDGQGLQTLYCGTGTSTYGQDFQWSPDQKFLAFNNNSYNQNPSTNNLNGTSTYSVQTLNLATGTLQTVFSFKTDEAVGINYTSWIDATHLYLYSFGPDGLNEGIYTLDITKGSNQQKSDLSTLLQAGPYKSFVSSYDRSQVYINYNGCGQVSCKPPSSIVALPAMGGTPHTLWQSTKYNVVQVCPVNSHQLLVTIEKNDAFGSIDTSNNGIWVMNNDGTGLTRLIPDNKQSSSSLNSCPYAWNVASRDGNNMYALPISNNQEHIVNLEFGPLDGSRTPTIFASGGNGLTVNIVGWTTM